jgi:hypothetical protein
LLYARCREKTLLVGETQLQRNLGDVAHKLQGDAYVTFIVSYLSFKSGMSTRINNQNGEKADLGVGCWKSTQDQKSGRVYYYNTKTKETTWTKPLELATPVEQAEMIRKKDETRHFFEDMEMNIMNKISKAQILSDSYDQDPDHRMDVDDADGGSSGGQLDPAWTEYKYTAQITRNHSANNSSKSMNGQYPNGMTVAETIGIEGPNGISYRIRTISSLDGTSHVLPCCHWSLISSCCQTIVLCLPLFVGIVDC